MTTEFGVPDPAKAAEFFTAKMQFTTGPIELDHQLEAKAKINVVDVREADDYARGHIPGAINLPKDRWDTLQGLMKDRVNVLYCYTQTCHLAATAAVQFAAKGFPVREMEGGFAAWKAAQLTVEQSGRSEPVRKAA